MKHIQTLKVEYDKEEDITIKLFTKRQMKEYVKLQDKSDASEDFMVGSSLEERGIKGLFFEKSLKRPIY